MSPACYCSVLKNATVPLRISEYIRECKLFHGLGVLLERVPMTRLSRPCLQGLFSLVQRMSSSNRTTLDEGDLRAFYMAISPPVTRQDKLDCRDSSPCHHIACRAFPTGGRVWEQKTLSPPPFCMTSVNSVLGTIFFRWFDCEKRCECNVRLMTKSLRFQLGFT